MGSMDLEELKKWECPECGSPGDTYRRTLAEMVTYGTTPEASYLMGHGVDPGPLASKTVPVSYDESVTCENGHESHLDRRFKP